MPYIEINDVGNYGVSKGAPYHELPPGMWTRIKNVRFKDMSVERFNGHSQVFGNLPSGAQILWMMPTFNTAGSAYWIYADYDRIWATDGTTHANISQGGTAASPYSATPALGWNGGNLNGVPFLNNGVDTPQYWTDWDVSTPAACADLPGFSAVYNKASVLRPFLGFIIALDVTESSVRYPFLVAWSDIADAGSLPTSWDYTSNTTKAGQYPLSGEGGILIDAQPLGDTLFVYKENAIHSMRFIGGGPVFDFKQVSTEIGALSRRCIKNFKKTQLVMGQGDVVIHNGGTPESILDQNERTKRLRSWFFSQIDSTNFARSFVVPNYRQNEIWCCIVETGADFPTLALVWNYKENTFGVRDLTDTITSGADKVYGIPHIAYGIVDESGPTLWDSASGFWDSYSGVWDATAYNPTVLKLLLANYGVDANLKTLSGSPVDGMFFVGDTGSDFNGIGYESYCERTGLAIIGKRNDGGYNVDVKVNKFVRAVIPRIDVVSGSGTIDIYVGSQQYVDGSITWEGPYAFDPTTDEKINCTVNGRFIAVRFQSQSSSNLLWKLRGYALEMSLGARW